MGGENRKLEGNKEINRRGENTIGNCRRRKEVHAGGVQKMKQECAWDKVLKVIMIQNRNLVNSVIKFVPYESCRYVSSDF